MEIDELSPLLILKSSQRESTRDRSNLRERDTGPIGDLADGCRSEPAEITPNHMLETGGLRDPSWSYPLFGQGVEVGAALVPGARGRNANHVDPLRDTIPGQCWVASCGEQVPQAGGPTWAAAEVLSASRDRGLHVDCAEPLACASPPFLARLLDGRHEECIVSRRDHVNRAPQQGALDHLPPLERGRQRATPEGIQARPETDVARWGVLRLQPADTFERLH